MVGGDHGGAWPAPTASGPLDATVTLPGSKSLTNRYLVLAALANDRSRLRCPLLSRDTELMAAALVELGADIELVPGLGSAPDWIVAPPDRVRGGGKVDCGLAGTVMRFLPPVAALADGDVRFDGDEAARRRPMGPILAALRELGAHVVDDGGAALPFTVHGTGRLRGGEVTLDASASSQFVSALLLTGARFDEGITVRHVGPPVPSQPHIAMTVETLRDAGVDVDDSEADVWRVSPSEINALDVHVEPDLSNAGPFVAAALVATGRVRIPDWPQHTTQAGDAMRDILDAMGAEVTLDRSGLTVIGTGELVGIDVDLHDAAELTPTVVALAALASTPSRITGVAHIRGHETDRIAALATEINGMGGAVTAREDGFLITPKSLRGIRFHSYADHRMATAGAILGLRVPDVSVEDIDTTAKTLPGFAAMWSDMVATGAKSATPHASGPARMARA